MALWKGGTGEPTPINDAAKRKVGILAPIVKSELAKIAKFAKAEATKAYKIVLHKVLRITNEKIEEVKKGLDKGQEAIDKKLAKSSTKK